MFFRFKPLTTLKPHKNPTPHSLTPLTVRTFIDSIEISYVRDRGLDHAVEKEKDLKPLVTLKNMLKQQPSNSLPLSSIVEVNTRVRIPYRPIEFIRRYPCFFEEFYPGNVRVHPHVRLTQQSLDLDGEEMMVYGSDLYRKSCADRLCKVLMLCCVNEIPLTLIDRLKWDLGLPDDYVTSLVPEFPDYFRVRKSGGSVDGVLELVCWSDELSVSVLEGKVRRSEMGYQNGMPIAFPLSFSNGFVMDKRLKKWVDEWQKLGYVSPYENATHLQPNSDESDKWVVGVLHEFLNLLVSKKIERDDVLCFGEYLGIRSRMKRALVHHPGIFYMSNKIGTHTVVLRDGYKRDVLIEKNPLVEIRNKYIHLMHNVKKVENPKTVLDTSAGKKQMVKANLEGNDGGKEEGVGVENESEEEEEEENERRSGRRGSGRRGHEKEARMGDKYDNGSKNRRVSHGSGRRGHEKEGRMGGKYENEENRSSRGRTGRGRGYMKEVGTSNKYENEENKSYRGRSESRRGYKKEVGMGNKSENEENNSSRGRPRSGRGYMKEVGMGDKYENEENKSSRGRFGTERGYMKEARMGGKNGNEEKRSYRGRGGSGSGRRGHSDGGRGPTMKT